MVKFLNYMPEFMNGSLITLSDTYLELLKYVNCSMYFKFFDINSSLDGKKLIKVQKSISNYMCVPKYSSFKDFSNTPNDIVVTSMFVISNMDVPKGNTLIVLDTLDVYLEDKNGTLGSKLTTLSNNYEKVYFLCNPFNMDIISKYIIKLSNIEAILYYNKISKIRLDQLKENTSNKVLIRNKDLLQYYDNYFLYEDRLTYVNTLKFYKHAFVRMGHGKDKDIFVENVGKIFFEYLLLDKEVDYYPFNKTTDDGMHHYMKLIGLNSNQKLMNIKINDEEKNKILFGVDDLLIKIIKESQCTH